MVFILQPQITEESDNTTANDTMQWAGNPEIYYFVTSV